MGLERGPFSFVSTVGTSHISDDRWSDVEGAGLGATLCPISVALVVRDQKLLAVSCLEGDLREELLLE
jgi:hypothetical protein